MKAAVAKRLGHFGPRSGPQSLKTPRGTPADGFKGTCATCGLCPVCTRVHRRLDHTGQGVFAGGLPTGLRCPRRGIDVIVSVSYWEFARDTPFEQTKRGWKRSGDRARLVACLLALLLVRHALQNRQSGFLVRNWASKARLRPQVKQ